MNTAYITYAQMEEQAVSHYRHYGARTSFKSIAQYLFRQQKYQTGTPALPGDIMWGSLDDAAFFEILGQLPVQNIFTGPDPLSGMEYTIAAEAIMPETLEVYSIKYIRDIIEKMHTHNFFELNYVFSGTCSMLFENEARQLKEGELCIIAPHSRHDVTVTDDSVVVSLMLRKNTFETTFFHLLAQEDLLASFFRSILYSNKESANYMLFVTDNSSEIRSAIKNIFMESYVRDSYSNTCIISRMHLFFSLLLRGYSGSIQFYENQKTPGSHASFTQLLQYIQSHYQTLTLDTLAAAFHYNPSYLSRLIKKNTGQTLIEILTKLRISKASDLLLYTDLKIDDIARAVGYDSADHFSRQFKKMRGTSPSELRKSATAPPSAACSTPES